MTFITYFETLFQRVIHEMRVARKSIPQLKSFCERCCETSILWVSQCARDSIHTSSIHAHDSSESAFAVGKLNHVAIAVPDVQAAAARYREVLGAHTSSPQPLPEHGVRVVFVTLENVKLELLEPFGDDSPISKFLQKNPSGGMHHMCLEVPNIDSAVRHIANVAGVRLLDKNPKIGAHGVPVVFMHPKDMCGVLMEIEESDHKQ